MRTAAREWLARHLGAGAISRRISSRSRRTSRRRARSACADADDPPDVRRRRRPLFAVVGGRPADRDCVPAGRRSRSCSPARRRWTRISAMAPLARNLPVLLGLVGVLECALARPFAARSSCRTRRRSRGCRRTCSSFQLESNGKRVHARRRAGRADRPAPALWGDVGTDSQHAFFQWLHQGTHEAPVEFIVPVRAQHPLARPADAARRQRARAGAGAARRAAASRRCARELRSQGLSGARARRGRARAPLSRQPRVDDAAAADARRAHLGALLALYEHRTFVEGVLYGHQLVRPVGRRARQDARAPIVAALAGECALPDATSTRRRARSCARVRALAVSEALTSRGLFAVRAARIACAS